MGGAVPAAARAAGAVEHGAAGGGEEEAGLGRAPPATRSAAADAPEINDFGEERWGSSGSHRRGSWI